MYLPFWQNLIAFRKRWKLSMYAESLVVLRDCCCMAILTLCMRPSKYTQIQVKKSLNYCKAHDKLSNFFNTQRVSQKLTMWKLCWISTNSIETCNRPKILAAGIACHFNIILLKYLIRTRFTNRKSHQYYRVVGEKLKAIYNKISWLILKKFLTYVWLDLT